MGARLDGESLFRSTSGWPLRLFIVDRTPINVTALPEYHLADLFIGARTPAVYTMGRRNLERLAESVNLALLELDHHEGSQ